LQVPVLMLASFVAFNVLSTLSIRIINRKKAIRAPSNCALMQHGCEGGVGGGEQMQRRFVGRLRRCRPR
jgi:hypothetical protein